MPDVPISVRALVADASGEDTRLALRSISGGDLGEGDVLVAITWSSINYKDRLAARKDGKVARIHPLVPGIDLAGKVVDPGSSSADRGDA